MEDTPLISVVIPVYKVEKYLCECVDSVINQTYKNLDIILVDDGSPDNCPAICDDYAKKDSRIRVIHKPNGGISTARNAGIKIAKGEYISLIDSDDYVTEIYIEQLYNALRTTKANAISCCQYTIHPEKLSSVINGDYKMFSPFEAVKSALSGGKVGRSAWGKLHRTEVFTSGDGIYYPDGLTSQDFAVMPSVFHTAETIIFSDNTTYFYRIREDATTKTLHISKPEDYYITYSMAENSAKKLFPQQWPELSKYFRNDYIQNTMRILRGACLAVNSPKKADVDYQQIISDLTKRITIPDAINFMFSSAGLPKKLATLLTAFMPKLAVKIMGHSGKYTPVYR